MGYQDILVTVQRPATQDLAAQVATVVIVAFLVTQDIQDQVFLVTQDTVVSVVIQVIAQPQVIVALVVLQVILDIAGNQATADIVVQDYLVIQVLVDQVFQVIQDIAEYMEVFLLYMSLIPQLVMQIQVQEN